MLAVFSSAAGCSLCRNTKALYGALRLIAAIALVGAAALHGALADDRRGTTADPTRAIAFDLPAQPLESALEAYSVASGWQVVYNASLAARRRSSDVKGDFTPDAALRALLAGTGLMPQYKAADGAILVPDPMATLAPDDIADVVDPSLKDYYGLVQTGLKRVLCASRQIRTGSYRIALELLDRIAHGDACGASGSTGRVDIDESFNRAVGRSPSGAAPPAGFSQPVVLLVTPDLVAKCNAVDASMPPIGATR